MEGERSGLLNFKYKSSSLGVNVAKVGRIDTDERATLNSAMTSQTEINSLYTPAKHAAEVIDGDSDSTHPYGPAIHSYGSANNSYGSANYSLWIPNP